MKVIRWETAALSLAVALLGARAGLAEEPSEQPTVRFTSAEVYVAGKLTTQPWETVPGAPTEVLPPGITPSPEQFAPYYADSCPAGGCPTTAGGAQPGTCPGGCDLCGESSRFLDVGFWVAGGATLNPDDPVSNYNGPLTFNDRVGGQLNQLYLYLAHEADNGGCGLALGGRVDLMYGTDARFAEALGLEDNWNNRRFYHFAMPQLYAEVALNNLRVKMGHYYTILGYESVMAPQNFFYSHAYTMQYGEPFTHTGMLASYDATQTLTLHGGFDRGWNNWEDNNDDLSFLGGVSWDGGYGSTAAFTVTLGDEASRLEPIIHDDRYVHSLVISQKLDDRTTYVFQHDLGHQNHGLAQGQDAEWYGINQYLLYRMNCCWSAGARFEWFRDDDGARVRGLGDGNPIADEQFAGNFYALSLGMNYRPTDRITFRPEVRYDWFVGTGTALPFNDGTKDEQFTAAMDVIWNY
jgi:hypothetical protein